MSRVFRRLRVDAIVRDRARKYLTYAFGEIILIVLGILIALQINTWNESRKSSIKEDVALRQIRADLVNDLAEMDWWIDERVNSDVPYLARIYTKDWDGVALDSLPLRGTRYFNFQPFASAYHGIKSSDNLSTIKSDSLRESVIYYYEREHLSLHDWSSWHKNFVINVLEPYMYDELYINPNELVDDLDHLKAKLNERQLNSLISTQIGSMRRIGVRIQEVKSQAEDIIERIDRELESD